MNRELWEFCKARMKTLYQSLFLMNTDRKGLLKGLKKRGRTVVERKERKKKKKNFRPQLFATAPALPPPLLPSSSLLSASLAIASLSLLYPESLAQLS